MKFCRANKKNRKKNLLLRPQSLDIIKLKKEIKSQIKIIVILLTEIIIRKTIILPSALNI